MLVEHASNGDTDTDTVLLPYLDCVVVVTQGHVASLLEEGSSALSREPEERGERKTPATVDC